MEVSDPAVGAGLCSQRPCQPALGTCALGVPYLRDNLGQSSCEGLQYQKGHAGNPEP